MSMLGQASAGFQAGPSAPSYGLGGTGLPNHASMLSAPVKNEHSVPGLGLQVVFDRPR